MKMELYPLPQMSCDIEKLQNWSLWRGYSEKKDMLSGCLAAVIRFFLSLFVENLPDFFVHGDRDCVLSIQEAYIKML